MAGRFFLWGWGYSRVDLGFLVGLYVLAALGITVGFHRLFTHCLTIGQKRCHIQRNTRLGQQKARAMASPPLSSAAKKNVETIAKVERQLVGRRTQMDRMGDAIARFFGTLRFVVAHALFFTCWFVLNLGLLPNTQPFDPYPFPFLGLIVAIEFIFLTTFVLMNQNLQSRREEQWSHLNLQLAMLAEHEVTKNMQMLHMICKHLGLEHPTGDSEVNELAQATPVTTLVDEIAHKLGETKNETT